MPTGTNAFFDAMLVFQCVSGDSPFLGFAAFLGPVVFIELPVAILELVNGEGFSSSMDGDGWLKNARMVLIIMRILCTSKEAFVNSDLLNNI